MKRISIILLLVLLGTIAKSQSIHQLKDQIKSQNWNLISSVKFNEKSFDEIYPIYPPEIKEYNGKAFELKGYLIPIERGKKHGSFLLSALPLNQCSFCGKNGIPLMVLVKMDNPIDFSLRPISVIGILNLSSRNLLDGMHIIIEHGKLVE